MRNLIIAILLLISSESFGQCKPLYDYLFSGGTNTGFWSEVSAPTGSSVSSQLIGSNPCVDFSNSNGGLYVFSYKLCTSPPNKVICDSIETCYFKIDTGFVEVKNFNLCLKSGPITLVDSLMTADFGDHSDYEFNSTSSGLSQGSDYLSSTFDPTGLSVSNINITFTCTPFSPPEAICNGTPIPIDPECVPKQYNFIISLIDCCFEINPSCN